MGNFCRHLLLAGIIGLAVLSSCSKADFVIGKDGWPLASEHISGAVFQKVVDGHGWRFNSAYLIDSDGRLSGEPYYSDKKDQFPVDYLFSGSNVTEYWDLDEYPDGIFRVRKFQYDESVNGILIDGTSDMRISSLKEDFIVAVVHVGNDTDGRKIFIRSTWRRMDEDELEDVKRSHPLNYSRLLRKDNK
ncbi:MAG: hypothetical protein LIR35_07805 [Bacteroidota bacterium]|nr:hypothetical protein [Bacteroidota bacterium]